MAAPTFDNPYDELFTRIAALERVCLTSHNLVKVDISNDWPYTQNTFPYVVNRLLPTEQDDLSEDINHEEQRVGIRIVVGNATDGEVKGRAIMAYRILYFLRKYFRRYDRLTDVTEDDANSLLFDEPNWLGPEGVQLGPHTGMGIFQGGGVGNGHYGVECSLIVPVLQHVF